MSEELPDGMPDKLFFRIGEAASLVGVEAHVLRYWENEFKMRTQRSSTGQRMYRRKDIARFLEIRKLLHEDGFTIAGARKALESGGVSTSQEGAADHARVREALERVTTLRSQVGTIREQYGAVGVAPFLDNR